MKLEVGKKYRTREGKVVKITCTTADVGYKFKGDNTFTYTPQGEYYIDTPSTYDLVEEIKTSGVKLEVGKVYRTECGAVAIVKTYDPNPHLYYPFIVKVRGHERGYNEDGFHCSSHVASSLNIIEEIKENTMFNKDYKYLFIGADGYNKASIHKPYLRIDGSCWCCDDVLFLPKNFFNLGDDWKESLREIVYNNDGSIYLRKPRYEFKVDDKVLVRNVGDSSWTRRHFCRYSEEGYIECYKNGYTSFTVNDTVIWDEIKPYEEEA